MSVVRAFVILCLIIASISISAKKKKKPTFDRYLCESTILDGNDPGNSSFQLQFRWGRRFTDGDCKLSSQSSQTQPQS